MFQTFLVPITAFLLFLQCGHGSEIYDAIVVGTGPSGMAALTRLTERGFRVIGLEAGDRIGGRVNTQEFGEGLVEFGAEWIHGVTGNVVYELAEQHNVSLKNMDVSVNFHVLDNPGVSAEEMKDLHEFSYGVYNDIHDVDNETMGDCITRRYYEYLDNKPEIKQHKDFTENFLKCFELFTKGNEGTDSWNDISPKGASDYDICNGSQTWSWHTHGYRTLFEILLHKYNNGTGLPVDIRFGQEVSAVDWSQAGKVAVQTKGGNSYDTRAVIMTPSLGVLKHNHQTLFHPSLPSAKVNAIQTLAFGTVNKICLFYETSWWDTNAYNAFVWSSEKRKALAKEDLWLTKISGFSTPMSNSRVITMWITGEAARHMETLTLDVVKNKTKMLLEVFYGHEFTIPDAKDIRRSTWFSNPLFRGSYSYHGLAWDKYPTAASDLASPLVNANNKPVVLFAGEATSINHHYSTVHGALESGWREAERIRLNYGD